MASQTSLNYRLVLICLPAVIPAVHGAAPIRKSGEVFKQPSFVIRYSVILGLLNRVNVPCFAYILVQILYANHVRVLLWVGDQLHHGAKVELKGVSVVKRRPSDFAHILTFL